MTLLDIIQECVRQSMNAAQLTDMVVGTVTGEDPLEIQIDSTQATLTGAVLLLTDNVLDLALDDKVILLRVQRGQRFIVLSRVH